MNWKLRYTNEGVISSYLIPYLKKGFENRDHTQEINQIEIAQVLCRFISTIPTQDIDSILIEPKILLIEPYNQIFNNLIELDIDIPYQVDNKLFLSIQNNKLYKMNTDEETNNLRNRLLEFGEKIKNIQHYCYYSKIVELCRLLGKLLTRIWWIYHDSSPIMKPIYYLDD
jgi:hypothetical protein